MQAHTVCVCVGVYDVYVYKCMVSMRMDMYGISEFACTVRWSCGWPAVCSDCAGMELLVAAMEFPLSRSRLSSRLSDLA